MAKKSIWGKVGAWAFILGLVVSIVIAIFSSATTPAWAVIVLAILGVIVGLLNISDAEVNKFLVASIAFLLSFQALAAITQAVALGWDSIGVFFNLVSVFIAPAAAIVAIKSLYSLSKD